MKKDKFGLPLDSFCPQFWEASSATSPLKIWDVPIMPHYYFCLDEPLKNSLVRTTAYILLECVEFSLNMTHDTVNVLRVANVYIRLMFYA